MQVGLLDDYSLYPFLHKKHVDLAPKLAEVLRQMKAEGFFEQDMAQTAKEVEANK